MFEVVRYMRPVTRPSTLHEKSSKMSSVDGRPNSSLTLVYAILMLF